MLLSEIPQACGVMGQIDRQKGRQMDGQIDGYAEWKKYLLVPKMTEGENER